MVTNLTRFAFAAFCAVAGPTQADEFLKMGTLAPGGTIYTITSGFAQAVSTHVPEVEVQINATGSAAQHMLSAAKGELDFFYVFDDPLPPHVAGFGDVWQDRGRARTGGTATQRLQLSRWRLACAGLCGFRD